MTENLNSTKLFALTISHKNNLSLILFNNYQYIKPVEIMPVPMKDLNEKFMEIHISLVCIITWDML